MQAISAAAKALHEERHAWLNPANSSADLKDRTLTNLYNALQAYRSLPDVPEGNNLAAAASDRKGTPGDPAATGFDRKGTTEIIRVRKGIKPAVAEFAPVSLNCTTPSTWQWSWPTAGTPPF